MGSTRRPGITVAPGGIATVGVGLIQNLEKSRVQLTYLAILFVGLFLTFRLRSLVRALLSLVPVLVAVGAVSLIGVAFHLKLSPVTAVAGPLVVAVCTEFTSLILLRFVEERARGLTPRQAMDATARRTGRAFMVSGMTAIAGVAVLGVSSMPLLSDFGIIVAINITVALLERPDRAPAHLGVGRPAQLGVAWTHQEATGAVPDETIDERYPEHVDSTGRRRRPRSLRLAAPATTAAAAGSATAAATRHRPTPQPHRCRPGCMSRPRPFLGAVAAAIRGQPALTRRSAVDDDRHRG